MTNLRMIISANARRIARYIYYLVASLFLSVIPVQWFWSRNEPSFQKISKRVGTNGLENFEYSLYSQNGEDGIIKYLFSQIGVSSKLFLEFGFGVVENNSLHLILKEGWGGVLIDGSEVSVTAFNKALLKLGISSVKAIHQFLNLENLKKTILGSGLPKQIDLLSIDVDGNDYWFWKDIAYLKPRVVVIEYNASLGPELSLTVPYDPFFKRHEKHLSGFYQGASLTALTKLAREKGYALVGCDSMGVNAFFVRNDCLPDSIKEISPLAAYRPHNRWLRRGFSLEYQYEVIKDMPYIKIE